MRFFTQHTLREEDGRFEIILYVNKKKLVQYEKNEVVSTIKKKAVDYLQTVHTTIPIRVVRIMIGSMLYFSFAVNQERQLSPLTKQI